MVTDRLIIGAGLYGLYAALFCAKQGESVCVLERDDEPFKRATYINQARVHMGYHYPRSLSTAVKSAGYYNRFHEDFGFCINDSFDQIYATSSQFSWTNSTEFEKFCADAGIFCERVDAGRYFYEGLCDGAFLTREDTYDAHILRDYYIDELAKYEKVSIVYSADIASIEKEANCYCIKLSNGDTYSSAFLLNASYASVNQILSKLSYDTFKIKYELCEIILCNVSDSLKRTGITVMDGPFFSIMPFGKTGYHSLTSVTFTPHNACYEDLPTFSCQEKSGGYCSKLALGNCNDCIAKPESAWPYMSSLARKYLLEDYGFEYVKSLYSMKPILRTTEIDDSRPTVVKSFSSNPTFVSVLSGKINTVYDLDAILKEKV
ncbi:MAG: FAD-dependent oxidoreductase [Lachnospiraceae bacterium]|nr:FAD-dependent oxidoreductase [Candidatus Colinaster scatohippi]